MKKVSKEIKPCEKLAKNFLSELKIPNSPTSNPLTHHYFLGLKQWNFFNALKENFLNANFSRGFLP
jgi:hypothetical protein